MRIMRLRKKRGWLKRMRRINDNQEVCCDSVNEYISFMIEVACMDATMNR